MTHTIHVCEALECRGIELCDIEADITVNIVPAYGDVRSCPWPPKPIWSCSLTASRRAVCGC